MTPNYPVWDVHKLDKRLRDLGCVLIRKKGSHRHYSNPFRSEQLVTFSAHSGDIPRGIIEDITKDLGLTKEQFYNLRFKSKR
jgi:predicted RNA binding protein YcfA (HicA-like mRNA interferase family)